MEQTLSASDKRKFRRTIKQILRVNHAGEYGAIRIYQAQVAVARLRNRPVIAFLRQTLSHEREHLAAFRELMWPRGTRPCGAMPLWGMGGTALGFVTALLGDNAILICTEAVERTVHAHLDKQLAWIAGRDPELSATIEAIREEELSHLIQAQTGQTARGNFANLLDRFVGTVTAALIWCSTYGALTRMKTSVSRP